MISPSALMKRVGVGGRLVPFFKCVCVYFAAMGTGSGAASGSPSAGAVAAKCAPVLCLLLVVLLHYGSLPYEKARYSRCVCAGLALSALGDALLMWPQHFVAGMGAFAAAHVAYIGAFRFRPLRPLLGGACYLSAAAYLWRVRAAGALRPLVPLYGALLATMAWRGAARGSPASTLGAALFLLSDAILGYSLFGADGPVPYKQVLVMSTYYLGQLGIALSALEPCAAA